MYLRRSFFAVKTKRKTSSVARVLVETKRMGEREAATARSFERSLTAASNMVDGVPDNPISEGYGAWVCLERLASGQPHR